MAKAREDDFSAATRLFDDQEIKNCIVACEANISDTTLPPYYIINNCILIACALDTWEEADEWKEATEQAYRAALGKADRMGDKELLELLGDLRKGLDELEGFRREDGVGEELDGELVFADKEREILDRKGGRR